MDKIEVLAISGGIATNSINKRLYNEMVKHNTSKLSFKTFDISTLPFYSQDIEYSYPASIKEFRELIKSADAILILTPEYNRSIPGVLKNALDIGSRPYGENIWNDKPAAIAGASIGAMGTFGAQQHLRNICSFLNMHVMSQPEFYFNASAHMTENGLAADSVKFVQSFLQSFETWVRIFRK
jgi:chromate reductase